MAPLPSNLRRDLERTIITARDVAERGARAALEALTVHEGKPGSHLSKKQRELRNRLRAHGRQLGDPRNEKSKAQAIDHLVHECAYEHWHRMIFARFLAENDLLVEPESGVSVTLEEVEELAREAGVDPWELASRFAQRMLPQIFRPDDPVLAVPLPTETRVELESLLESLPAAVFTADDSLGWVYQFWQSKRKAEVNASGEKITGDTLPAVTQLFTEHYMVLFLLHNTIGAWWAGKHLTAENAENAESEEELRRKLALPGVEWEYLRFVRDETPSPSKGQGRGDGDDDSQPLTRNSQPPWRPAAGTFDGWPRTAPELKVLDPCCGSGHFLVAAFELLARLRMAEEGLSAEDAARAVLRDNLHGLEIDPRCTQIAAFALAMAAWKFVGRVIDLPPLEIACSGIGPSATLDEWLKLAERAEHNLPRHAREPVRNGLENLHRLFSHAPTLGSLIDPTELPSDMFAADYDTLQPFLKEVFEREASDVELRERAVAAQGMVKAADLLAREYTLVITNVPYLARKAHCEVMSEWADANAPEARNDLATLFVLRCIDFLGKDGAGALVTPQNWFFLATYGKLRKKLLTTKAFHVAARLGPEAFEAITGHVVNVALSVIGQSIPSATNWVGGLDAQDAKGARGKADYLRGGDVTMIPQKELLANPDSRIILERFESGERLSEYAHAFQGVSPADLPHYGRTFWELNALNSDWRPWQSTVERTIPFGGRELILWWNEDFEDAVEAGVAYVRGEGAWGSRGVGIKQMGNLPATLYTGEVFDTNIAIIVPRKQSLIAAVWAYCASDDYSKAVRKLDRKMNVTNATLVKVPFDLAHWQKVAAEKYPDGLPEPESDDPTQWLFHGWPVVKEPAGGAEPLEGPDGQRDAVATLQVAVARLLGYRWPAELDDEMRLSQRARALVARCEELLEFADPDGIVCLPAVRSEATAAERLRRLLAAAYGDDWSAGREASLLAEGGCAGKSLDEWLRDKFFEQHCKLFHHRPFIWHIWDGKKDGFHALINYHKLAAPDGAGRKLLETLTYSYLGDWITRQQHGVKQEEPGAEARLAAAKTLQTELEKILEGEPPYDIFVRWKPLYEQPIGWEPDINDGVRLNIRPFMLAKDVGRKGAGILRFKPNIKWKKDRGKEPQRDKADFPWFWSWDEQTPDFPGGDAFDGNRWNDLHYTNAFKQAARELAAEKGEV